VHRAVKICRRFDAQTHASCALDDPVAFAFDLLTSGIMHADGLPWRIYVSTLLLIDQAVFTARRYASTVYAAVVSPSVRPSVKRQYCVNG